MSIAIPSTAPPGPEEEEIHYPASDGQPMAETGLHVQAIMLLFQALHDALPVTHFIAADMYWFWEERHPASRVAPDVMVVKAVGRSDRRSFFTWLEGGAQPCVVFEMASENTWREDLGTKRRLYERLGVREYFLFDPEGEYLRPRLMGFRLLEGRYELIEPDADDRLRSEELGLLLKGEGLMLRLFDATTGAPVPTREERVEKERLHAEQERLHAEQERLHAEQERLRAEQERLRAEQERLCAEQERRHAEQQRLHAEQQRNRADTLAAEVERLKALLEQRKESGGGGSATAE